MHGSSNLEICNHLKCFITDRYIHKLNFADTCTHSVPIFAVSMEVVNRPWQPVVKLDVQILRPLSGFSLHVR